MSTEISTIRRYLERQDVRQELAKALPRHMKVERVIKTALGAVYRDPYLLQCSPKSIYLACMQACQLGLEPGSPLGAAYLVPFFDKHTKEYQCTLIPGYKGLIDLARRSGQIATIEAHVVYEKDHFDCSFGPAGTLVHRPVWTGERGEVIAAWAMARLTSTGYQVEVMTRSELDAIRASAKSRSGPWVTHTAEMYRKTVVRRLCKYLPLSPELEAALTTDDHLYDTTTVEVEAPREEKLLDRYVAPALPEGTENNLRIELAEDQLGAPDTTCNVCGGPPEIEYKDQPLCRSCYKYAVDTHAKD